MEVNKKLTDGSKINVILQFSQVFSMFSWNILGLATITFKCQLLS